MTKRYVLYGQEYMCDGIWLTIEVYKGTRQECYDKLNYYCSDGIGQYKDLYVIEDIDIDTTIDNLVGKVEKYYEKNEKWPNPSYMKNIMRLDERTFSYLLRCARNLRGLHLVGDLLEIDREFDNL